jgi:hypothetical protein
MNLHHSDATRAARQTTRVRVVVKQRPRHSPDVVADKRAKRARSGIHTPRQI